jgi:hypothetical protein
MRWVAFLVLLWRASVVRADVAAPPTPTASVEQRARAVLDRWVQAQNRGDFAAYQALYAPGFSGIRRSGEKVVELDRSGWMRDRARMFKKKMRVRVDDLRITQEVQLTQFRFRQTWTSANYRDVGRKWLTVVDEGGGPLIVHEEMLESAKAERVNPLDNEDVALLRCLYKSVDARWRTVDDSAEVVRVESAPHADAVAIRVVFADHEALGLCRDGKLIARNDLLPLTSLDTPSCSTETEWHLQGDYMEVKLGLTALALVGDLRVIDNADGEEGCEVRIEGQQVQLYVPVNAALRLAFESTLKLEDGCDFNECTNRSCTIETAKRGKSGWFDLIEDCDFEDVEQSRVKKSYSKKTRYGWNGYQYEVRRIQP